MTRIFNTMIGRIAPKVRDALSGSSHSSPWGNTRTSKNWGVGAPFSWSPEFNVFSSVVVQFVDWLVAVGTPHLGPSGNARVCVRSIVCPLSLRKRCYKLLPVALLKQLQIFQHSTNGYAAGPALSPSSWRAESTWRSASQPQAHHKFR